MYDVIRFQRFIPLLHVLLSTLLLSKLQLFPVKFKQSLDSCYGSGRPGQVRQKKFLLSLSQANMSEILSCLLK